jgi:hypothetical protein
VPAKSSAKYNKHFFILGIERKVPSLPALKKTGIEWKDAGIENFTAMICWHPRLFLHERHITPFDTDMNDTDISSGEARVIHGYGLASNATGFFKHNWQDVLSVASWELERKHKARRMVSWFNVIDRGEEGRRDCMDSV